MGHGKRGFRHTKALICLTRGTIGQRLPLRTYRKSNTRFGLVPKSTTLDNLEGSLRTLFQNTYAMVLLYLFIFSFTFNLLILLLNVNQ